MTYYIRRRADQLWRTETGDYTKDITRAGKWTMREVQQILVSEGGGYFVPADDVAPSCGGIETV